MINAKTALSVIVSGTVACQLALAPALYAPAQAAANNQGKVNSAAEPGLGKAPAPDDSVDVTNATDAIDATDVSQIHTAIALPPSAKTATGGESSGAADKAQDSQQSQGSQTQSSTGSKNDVKANQSLLDAVRLEATVKKNLLKGGVQSNDRISPFLEGSVQSIPKGTQMELTFCGNVNSEISQKGDEVMMKVSANVPGGNGIAVPGGWFAHGFVTTAQGHKSAHRNGFVEIEFDKLISPDGRTEVDFPAKLSTKDNAMVSTLKQVAFGSKCTTVGAAGGAILSLQLTGIGGAVATHGISVGVGAGVGFALGIIGAVKRQGKPDSRYEGDDVKLVIAEPIMLPAFKADQLPSAKPVPVLKDMKISVNKARFAKDPSGDSESRLLDIDMTVDNHTKQTYSPRQLMVVDDRGHEFTPWIGEDIRALMRKIGPEQSERIDVLYEVNSGKRKYWLSLREKATGAELSRVPIKTD